MEVNRFKFNVICARQKLAMGKLIAHAAVRNLIWSMGWLLTQENWDIYKHPAIPILNLL